MSTSNDSVFSPNDTALLGFLTAVSVLTSTISFWLTLRLLPGWKASILPWWCISLGLIGGFLLVQPARSLSGRTLLRQLVLLLVSALMLPVFVQSDAPLSSLFQVGCVLSVVVSFLIAADVRAALDSMRGTEGLQMPDFLQLSPLAMMSLLLTLAGPPALRVYVGPTGQNLLLTFLVFVWFWRVLRVQGGTQEQWFVRGSGVLTFVWLLWAFFPWPSQLYGYTPLKAKSVLNSVYTLQARISEGKQYFAVTGPKSMIYDTVTAYRLNESLVHPAMSLLSNRPKRILVVGGETGGVLHELGKYKTLNGAKVLQLPLYPSLLKYFETTSPLKRLHLKRHKLKRMVLPAPARLDIASLQESLTGIQRGSIDLLIMDLPQPNASFKGILTPAVFRLWLSLLSNKGLLTMHQGSPYQKTPLYWCLVSQWGYAGAHVIPYHVTPGVVYDYGLVLVSKHKPGDWKKPLPLAVPTQYLTHPLDFRLLARFSRQTGPNGRWMNRGCLARSFQKTRQ